MPDEGFDPIRIVAALRARDVAFVVAGGLAAAARGSAVTTADVEVCVDDGEVNLQRVGLALEDLAASPSPTEDDDEHRATFGSVAGRFTIIELPGGFDALRSRAQETDLGRGVVVHVAALEDLMDLARATGDLEVAAHLAALTEDQETALVIEDVVAGEPRRRERVWSALERVDTFLTDLDAKGLKHRRDR
jgi:5-deoxy-D-glucuronate isomerase